MLRATAALLALSVLGACLAPPLPDRAASFGDGAILLEAPDDYCVDSVASKPSRDFAVLAPCVTLGVATPAPAVVGLVTVLAGEAGSGSIARDEIALRDFLITDGGKALLSPSGNAGDIQVLSTQAFNDQVMVHFTDQGTPPLAGLQNAEWRAFRNIGGRLVTIGVRGLAAAPLQDGPGASLLKEVIAGLRLVTRAAPATTTPQTPAETDS